MRHACLFSLFVALSLQQFAHGADPVFSGPQVGEKLPPFETLGVVGDSSGKKHDFVKDAKGKPVVLVFFHDRTRPAFGLTNLIMKYADRRAKRGPR